MCIARDRQVSCEHIITEYNSCKEVETFHDSIDSIRYATNNGQSVATSCVIELVTLMQCPPRLRNFSYLSVSSERPSEQLSRSGTKSLSERGSPYSHSELVVCFSIQLLALCHAKLNVKQHLKHSVAPFLALVDLEHTCECP